MATTTARPVTAVCTGALNDTKTFVIAYTLVGLPGVLSW